MDPIAFFIGLVFLLAAAACWRLMQPRINAAVLFLGLWGVLFVGQGIFRPLSDGLGPFTVVIVVAACGALALGVVAARLLRTGVSVAPLGLRVFDVPSLSRLVGVHIVLCATLLGYVLLQVAILWPTIQQVGGLWALFDSSQDAALRFRHIQAVDALSDAPAGGTYALSVLSYVLFLGNASAFTGVILARRGRWYWATVPLAINGLFSLISFQRTSFIDTVLLMGGMFMALASVSFVVRGTRSVAAPWSPRKRFRVLVGGLIGAAATAAVVLIPIQIRNAQSSDSTGLLSAFQYLYASIGGLNARALDSFELLLPLAADGSELVNPTFGSFTFTNFMALFQKLGLPVEVPPFFYDYYSVPILGREFSTNTATALYDPMLDGGFWFLIGFFFALGFGSLWLQTLSNVNMQVVLAPFVAVIFALLLWSFFVSEFTRDFRHWIVAGAACAAIEFWRRGTARSSPEKTVPLQQFVAQADNQ